MTPLCALSRKYGCDKGGVMEPYPNHRASQAAWHNYTPIYWELMHDWASEAWNILEIGIAEGRSARMWAEFFCNARIFCLDIDQHALKSVDRENRIYPIYCDQSDPESIKKALKKANKRGAHHFDYIIDDGSHIFEHQQATLNVLLPFAKMAYIIEDSLTGQPVMQPDGYSLDVYQDKLPSMLQIIRKK